jgi:hypothetical protein
MSHDFQELALKAIRRADEAGKSDVGQIAATQAVAYTNLAILQELKRIVEPRTARGVF